MMDAGLYYKLTFEPIYWGGGSGGEGGCWHGYKLKPNLHKTWHANRFIYKCYLERSRIEIQVGKNQLLPKFSLKISDKLCFGWN